ncbi:MAG TPA: T9SS type A sorting domain-containing protein, partial [Chitinophagaceae bacterium]|nr:T9SS type A sorting domain-containing protein [Chitinophagaceae bacterium]
IRVEVDRSGNGAQWVTGDPQTTPQTKLFDKTYKVTPANNNATGQYMITFYLTQAEATGWQLASTNPVPSARMIKYSDRINNMTYTSTFEQNNATWSSYLGGSDYQVSAQFNTGFSGFGFGIIPPSTLPVQLLSFTGAERNKMAELQWKSEGENNLSHYTVQRSRDGINYEDIGMVAARGTAGILNYNFTDINPNNGRNYYRLALQDHDGSKKLSNIITIAISNKIKYSIQPNPFIKVLTIAVENASGQMIHASLSDMSGKMIAQKNTIASANAVIQFDLPGLSAGIYYLKLNDGTSMKMFKVIKE